MKKHSFLLSITVLLVGAGVFWFFDQESEPTRIQSNEELAMLEQQVQQPAQESEPAAESQAYSIDLDVVWSAASHPETLPPGAHVSPFIAVVHKTPGSIIERNTRATPGLEDVAETGATNVFVSELDALIASGEVKEYAVGTRIDAPGLDTVSFEASQEFSHLTLVSMIAPSPDWLLAVIDFPLFNAQQWAGASDLSFQYLDAGTDDGASFTSANRDNLSGVIRAQINDDFIDATSEASLGKFSLTPIEQ